MHDAHSMHVTNQLSIKRPLIDEISPSVEATYEALPHMVAWKSLMASNSKSFKSELFALTYAQSAHFWRLSYDLMSRSVHCKLSINQDIHSRKAFLLLRSKETRAYNL